MTSPLSQTRSASLAVAAALLFIVAVASLHVLRPDVDPIRWGMSFYAIGRFGSVMTAAFVAFGVSVLALVAGLAAIQPAGQGSRVGLSLLGLSGTALLGVALFPSNAVPPVTRTDFAHVLASMVFFLGFAVGSPLVSWRLRQSRTTASVLAAAFVVTFIATILFRGSHGLFQRSAVAFALAWVITVASRLRGQANGKA